MFQFFNYKSRQKHTNPRATKVPVFTKKSSKNAVILRLSQFQFWAIQEDGNAAILGQPDTFEERYTEFLFFL